MSASLINLASAVVGTIFRPRRSLGVFVPDCVVDETHTDDLVITQHPVERGSPITDHAYKQPEELRVTYAWSNSNISAIADFSENYCKRVYQSLLELQASCVPIEVVTGKRTYTDMLIAGMTTTTNRETEYMLSVTIFLKKINLVSTQLVDLPPQENHAQPSTTAPVQDSGVRQPTEVSPTRQPAVQSGASAVSNALMGR